MHYLTKKLFVFKCEFCLLLNCNILRRLEGSIRHWSDDVIMWLRFLRRWCHNVTQVLEASVECFISFGSFSPLPHAANETHSFSLFICLSLSSFFCCFRFPWFHRLTFSNTHTHTQADTRTQGRQRGDVTHREGPRREA